jgi:CubicO group peptidase (beta-lactamase class C family)
MAELHVGGPEAIAARLVSHPEARGELSYQNINTALLGALLERLHGRPLEDILDDAIWQPAGAGEAFWRRYPATGAIAPYCCLYARAADWARVGRFLLSNGSAGAPFLPEELWREMLGEDIGADARRAGSYRHHFRHDILDRSGEPLQGPFSYMLGRGGQMVVLVPGRDLVIVRFGARHQKIHSTLYEVWRMIQPTVSAP